jgi:hypothetical protein
MRITGSVINHEPAMSIPTPALVARLQRLDLEGLKPQRQRLQPLITQINNDRLNRSPSGKK